MTEQDMAEVFDRRHLRRRRDRAAENFSDFEFLKLSTAALVNDCLDDVRREFSVALDLGCHTGQMANILKDRADIQTLVQTDLSEQMVRGANEFGLGVAADEEFLPFAAASFDLVVSAMALHWVNDLPGCLIQIRRILKPDGLFLGAFPGGTTLSDLRAALLDAEAELEGGAGPRVSPFADVRDGGDLLQRAGFALPVATSETLNVSYASPMALVQDLRGMGETNSVKSRRRGFSRSATLARALALYQERLGGRDGRITAGFEIIMLTGWAPAPGQPTPLTLGSGETSLKSVLE